MLWHSFHPFPVDNRLSRIWHTVVGTTHTKSLFSSKRMVCNDESRKISNPGQWNTISFHAWEPKSDDGCGGSHVGYNIYTTTNLSVVVETNCGGTGPVFVVKREQTQQVAILEWNTGIRYRETNRRRRKKKRVHQGGSVLFQPSTHESLESTRTVEYYGIHRYVGLFRVFWFRQTSTIVQCLGTVLIVYGSRFWFYYLDYYDHHYYLLCCYYSYLFLDAPTQSIASFASSSIQNFAARLGAIQDEESPFAFAAHNGGLIFSFNEPRGPFQNALQGRTRGSCGCRWRRDTGQRKSSRSNSRGDCGTGTWGWFHHGGTTTQPRGNPRGWNPQGGLDTTTTAVIAGSCPDSMSSSSSRSGKPFHGRRA